MISLIVAVVGATVSLVGLALAVRSLVLVLRAQRAVNADRRTSFHELLRKAEVDRLARQLEAEQDEIPWR